MLGILGLQYGEERPKSYATSYPSLSSLPDTDGTTPSKSDAARESRPWPINQRRCRGAFTTDARGFLPRRPMRGLAAATNKKHPLAAHRLAGVHLLAPQRSCRRATRWSRA